MKKLFEHIWMVALVFVLCGLATSSWAIPIQLQFTVLCFSDGLIEDLPPPEDPVTGTIQWDAAAVNTSINSLTSIDMTIDGYTYIIDEIGFVTPVGASSNFLIGATIGGIEGVEIGADDFFVRWDSETLNPSLFGYSTSKYNDFTQSEIFSKFEFTAIPEPTTILLFGSGLIGLVGFRRRFKKLQTNIFFNEVYRCL